MFHIKNHLKLNISLFFVSLLCGPSPPLGEACGLGSEESGEGLSFCAAPSPIGDVRVWVITLMVEVVEIWWRFAMVEGSMPGVISDGSTWEGGRKAAMPMWSRGHCGTMERWPNVDLWPLRVSLVKSPRGLLESFGDPLIV